MGCPICDPVCSPSFSGRSRTVSCGSSSRTVPIPVRIAQARARQACPSARAAALVIHWLRPSGKAVRPSRLAATLSRTQGKPRIMRDTNPRFNSRASSASRPHRTSMPASRKRSNPRPATKGLGSSIATTTRTTPASIRAFEHGGVRPKCAQGSNVT